MKFSVSGGRGGVVWDGARFDLRVVCVNSPNEDVSTVIISSIFHRSHYMVLTKVGSKVQRQNLPSLTIGLLKIPKGVGVGEKA